MQVQNTGTAFAAYAAVVNMKHVININVSTEQQADNKASGRADI